MSVCDGGLSRVASSACLKRCSLSARTVSLRYRLERHLDGRVQPALGKRLDQVPIGAASASASEDRILGIRGEEDHRRASLSP